MRLRPQQQAVRLAVIGCLLYHSVATAAAPQEVIPPNPVQQGLPTLKQATAPVQEAQALPPASEPTTADQTLPSGISRIDLRSRVLLQEVETLLLPMLRKKVVSAAALEQLQGKIWDLGRRNGRMLRVDLRVLPFTEIEGGSVLRAELVETTVRRVVVVQDGDGAVAPATLKQLRKQLEALLPAGAPLSLDRLDGQLKRRNYIGDVDVRANMVASEQDSVDINILVSAKQRRPFEWLAQADNQGVHSYGRGRLIAGVGWSSALTAGDRVDATGIESKGMQYLRLGYDMPLADLGMRGNAWNAYVRYRAPSGAKGYTAQQGVGLVFPISFTNDAAWIAYLNYARRHQVDRIDNGATTGDKRSGKVEAKLELNYALSAAQSLHLSGTLSRGTVDLSALPAVQAQDRASAATEGSFYKLEWDGSWNALFGPGGRFDVRLGTRGQVAGSNLDQGEKLALGGPVGVRAYGSSEALGDDGVIANIELGYRLTAWMRASVFYDVGRIRRFHHPWAVERIPPMYTLKGAGLGLSFSYRSLAGSIVYARQLGVNPGLSALGLDAEDQSARYRLWLSLTGSF